MIPFFNILLLIFSNLCICLIILSVYQDLITFVIDISGGNLSHAIKRNANDKNLIIIFLLKQKRLTLNDAFTLWINYIKTISGNICHYVYIIEKIYEDLLQMSFEWEKKSSSFIKSYTMQYILIPYLYS